MAFVLVSRAALSINVNLGQWRSSLEILDCCADSKTPAAAAVTMLTSVDFIIVGGTHRRTVEEKNGHCDEFRMSSHMNLLPGIEVVMMGA